MTERIERLLAYTTGKTHHKLRKAQSIDPAAYRDAGLADYQRTALRLKLFLEAETPVLLPDERIVFTRTLPAAPRIYSDQEWADITAGHFIHEQGNCCNLSPDYEKVLKVGLKGLLERIEKARTPETAAYHQAMAQSIQAVLDLTARYARLAREQGREAVAQALDRVPAYPPRSFPEALQSLRVLHFCLWCEGDYHNTFGRFDQYMYPYLEKDLNSGALTQEQALEYLEEFFLACNRDSDLYPGIQQGDNGQSMVLGGMTPEGADGYNLLSHMCLVACGELKVIDPKINLRVNRDTPLEIFEEGTRLTKLGLGFPQYENDDVVIPGLMKLGYEEGDARNYAVAACWEFIIPGRGMDIPNIGAVSLAGAVDGAIRAALPQAGSIEQVKAKAAQQIREQVEEIARSVKNLYVIPSPYLSLFFDGCLEQGRDISLGNKYNNYGLHGTGLSSAADSLAAVQQVVFEEGMAPEELTRAMDENFEGREVLLHHLRYDCPKMGNDDDRADQMGAFLLDAFAGAVKGLVNQRGGIFRAGTGSAMFYLWHAGSLGATADGRLRGEPLAANYAPALGVRVKGPASILRSFAKPDLTQVVNGGPLTIEFHDTVFRSADSIRKVALLVRSFILDGGHQLQLNTVNREQLLDAQRHPENYKNLIVRVWGWSGYFVELDKCYQDHIIKRVELNA